MCVVCKHMSCMRYPLLRWRQCAVQERWQCVEEPPQRCSRWDKDGGADQGLSSRRNLPKTRQTLRGIVWITGGQNTSFDVTADQVYGLSFPAEALRPMWP
jgi:hypothetical protein